ncbi:MAG TPA: aldo/keto reductase [Spirochaetia bacterium]|nr:aldo/keto reductase [Spirochaetia bacterium]
MQYRTLGREERVSALGFGCMRLPTLGQPSLIDEKLATRMLRYAIDQGVNYVDTAYPYHGGMSEPFVGRALRDGYRERVNLATKLPVWLTESIADCDRIFNEQLSKLQTDHLDFYLLHALDKERWAKVKRLGIVDWALEQKQRGRTRYVGFSFHDSASVFPTILDGSPDWDFCQLQYNFMDEEHQAGTAGLELAAARGLGVIVMEPLLGGALVNPPPSVQEIWAGAPIGRTPAAWALHWLWNKPEVGILLSGMTAFEQVEENLRLAGESGVGSLTKAELALYPRAKVAYDAGRPIPCTECGYCTPCPSGVNIPGNFSLHNEAVAFDRHETAKWRYNNFFPEATRAGACIRCNECLEKCPQGIEIPDRLEEIEAAYAG